LAAGQLLLCPLTLFVTNAIHHSPRGRADGLVNHALAGLEFVLIHLRTGSGRRLRSSPFFQLTSQVVLVTCLSRQGQLTFVVQG
jgi:hypothetical protein